MSATHKRRMQSHCSEEAVPLQALQNGTVELPSGKLTYAAPTGMQKFATSLRLIRALPWRRFKKGSVLVLEVQQQQQQHSYSLPIMHPIKTFDR